MRGDDVKMINLLLKWSGKTQIKEKLVNYDKSKNNICTKYCAKLLLKL